MEEKKFLYQVYIDETHPEECAIVPREILREWDEEQHYYLIDTEIFLSDKTYKTDIISEHYINRWVNLSSSGGIKAILKTSKTKAEELFRDKVYELGRKHRKAAQHELDLADDFFKKGGQYDRYDD